MRGRLLAVCLTSLVWSIPSASSTPPELTAENVAAFFDAAFTVQQKDHEVVGAVVAVVHDGAVLFKRGYGYADLETRTPADPEQSLFRIASITKPFIWTAVMQLVEQGRLSVDDPVDDHLNFEIPQTYPEPIRIRHLLTHTPGFEEINTGGSARSVEDVVPLKEHLMNRMPARVRPPGVHASYSNYGTALAGYIVERISGQTWSDYLDEHILSPLEMASTNTQVEMAQDLKARHAKGYRYDSGRFEANDYVFFRDLPAGHISTTADDMTRFMLAHLNLGALGEARILETATASKMREPLFDPHPGIDPMLHGFFRSDRNGLEIFGHGGDVNQFHSNMSLIPSRNLGVFISFNSDPGAAARSNLVAAFLDHFFPSEYLRAAPEAAQIDLEPYAGEYLSLRSNFSTFERLSLLVNSITVAAADGELLVAGNGVSRWIPLEEDRFTARHVDRTMVFERDASGDVTHMVIGSPLGTYKRLTGFHTASLQQQLFGFVGLVALLTVLGYGYRAFRRADQQVRLPGKDVLAAWLYALLILCLYGYLVVTLTGNVEEFRYGMPTSAHLTMLMTAANTVFGLLIVYLSARQWLGSLGGVLGRMRYTVIAVAALVNLFISIYFNIMAYPFQ